MIRMNLIHFSLMAFQWLNHVYKQLYDPLCKRRAVDHSPNHFPETLWTKTTRRREISTYCMMVIRFLPRVCFDTLAFYCLLILPNWYAAAVMCGWYKIAWPDHMTRNQLELFFHVNLEIRRKQLLEIMFPVGCGMMRRSVHLMVHLILLCGSVRKHQRLWPDYRNDESEGGHECTDIYMY